ncbi:Os01g0310100, partial [Oryza sativa Japonica Group]
GCRRSRRGRRRLRGRGRSSGFPSRRGRSTSCRGRGSSGCRGPTPGTSRPCCSPTPSRSSTSRWLLYKKASQVLYLHFALKRRAFLEEFHEKQEQVKEWLQNLGIGEHIPVVHDDDEADDVHVPSQHDEHSVKNRNVPSSAVLPVIRPALGRQQSVSDRAKVAMQEYLNHFLGNMEIVNSREVCKFLEVSLLSFLPEYGPKLKEDYVTVGHLPKIDEGSSNICCLCGCFSFCNSSWQKVWAVLKPGFLALLQDPFDPKLLDIVIFDVSPHMDRNGEGQSTLAREIKEHNPLHFAFEVSSGGRTIKLRTRSSAKVKDWVSAINTARRPPEGWSHPHRFGSFAPPRGLTEDGSVVQWFLDGQAAFNAIASSIEEAKSEIFITDWWLCPELYLRRPFHHHESSRLDILLESRAKQGVQVCDCFMVLSISSSAKIMFSCALVYIILPLCSIYLFVTDLVASNV